MNIEDTLAPTSDQLDAIELVAGPRTFTITDVSRGSTDQPLQISLAEFPRVWRPSKGMRRVLAAGWGTDASKWVGRSVTLYFDPNVSFGRERTGGTRISHMSHIDKPLSVPLLVTRGKSAIFTVQPLTDAPKPATRREPTREEVAACTDLAKLRAMHDAAGPEMRALILARRDELTSPDDAA